MQIPLSPASLHKYNFCLPNSWNEIPSSLHHSVEIEMRYFYLRNYSNLLIAFHAEVHSFHFIFLFFLTFLVVEVNLAIYMFLESIGSSVCIQYQERYIFLSSSSFRPSWIWTQTKTKTKTKTKTLTKTKTKYWLLCLHSILGEVYFTLFLFVSSS